MAYFFKQFTIVLHLKCIEVALAQVCWRLVTICLHSAVVARALSRAEKATSVEPFSYGYNGRKGLCSARLS